MKKFAWPYQRLLDIKQKQEHAIRAELILLTEEAAGIRGRILMLRMLLRNMLVDLKDRDDNERIRSQAAFMQHVHVKDAEIGNLNRHLRQVEQKRNDTLDAMQKLRQYRKALEQLREKALAEYHHEVHRREQNELDDTTNATFARAILTRS